MTNRYYQELDALIMDYQLWIASIEQYLEDNQLYQKHVNKRLEIIKNQLQNIWYHDSLLVITDKIISIDQSLKKIQLTLLQPSYSTV
jgi:hypothetical protein